MGKMKNKGFTLMEVLVVSGIMTLFALTVISVFLSTVRGGSKAQLVQVVHQDGDFALKRMAAMIRNGLEADCIGDFTITNSDGGMSSFTLVEDDSINRIASNSSEFLTGKVAKTSDLSFTCYDGYLGNQVVTIKFTLTAGGEAGAQLQEKLVQEFATSVATRHY
jgi:prepilin-type N-terminal cleavage/methylation domain-containing protein